MILDYMFTYGGPELFVLFTVVIVTPVLYLCGLKRLRWRFRIAAIASLWLAAIAVAFTDVYLIAREARRLCAEEAGLHVFRKARFDGLAGLFQIEGLSQYGVTYVEYRVPGSKQIYRESMKRGQRYREAVDRMTSEYEFVSFTSPIGPRFTQVKEMIRHVSSEYVLGEIVSFQMYPGWLDSHLIGTLGFSWSPPTCDGRYRPEHGKITISIHQLIAAVNHSR